MASGDFLELAQRACYQSRFRIDNTDDLNRAKEVINEGYLSILDMGVRWRFLEREITFNINTSGDTYTFAAIASSNSMDGIKDIHHITNDTNGGSVIPQMDWFSLENMARSTQDGDPSGCPYAVAIWDSRLRFYPFPDQTYEIGALCIEGDNAMVDNGDVPLIPIEWRHRILVPYAAMRLWEQQSGGESLSHARYYREQYERDMLAFRERFASTLPSTLGLDSPGFSTDLPGSVVFDHGYYDADY